MVFFRNSEAGNDFALVELEPGNCSEESDETLLAEFGMVECSGATFELELRLRMELRLGLGLGICSSLVVPFLDSD